MSYDPLGFYKGNRYDPDFAAKKKAKYEGKKKSQHDKRDHPQQQQHHDSPHDHRKQKQHNGPPSHQSQNGSSSSYPPAARFDSGYAGPSSTIGAHSSYDRSDQNTMGNSQGGYSRQRDYDQHSNNNGNFDPRQGETYVNNRQMDSRTAYASSDRGGEYGGRDARAAEERSGPPPASSSYAAAASAQQNAFSTPTPIRRPMSPPPLPISAVSQPSVPSGAGTVQGAELSALEKLKLFKQQVEASRNGRNQAQDLNRAAESFLESVGQAIDSQPHNGTGGGGLGGVGAVPPSPAAAPPAPSNISKKTPVGEAEEGEITESTTPREQVLKDKIKKLKQAKAKLAAKGSANASPATSAPKPAAPPIQTSQAPNDNAPYPTPLTATRESSPFAKRASLTPLVPTHGTYAEAARERAEARARDSQVPQQTPRQYPQRGRSASPGRGARVPSPRHASPPRTAPVRRYASPPPAGEPLAYQTHEEYSRRRESDTEPQQRSLETAQRGRQQQEYIEQRPAPVREYEPIMAAPAPAPAPTTVVANPSGEWVIKTLHLLKAQIAELEKLVVPATMSAPVVASSPAPPPSAAPLALEYREPPRREYAERPRESPARAPYRDEPSSSSYQGQGGYKTRKHGNGAGFVHDSRKEFVPFKKTYDNSRPSYESDSGYAPKHQNQHQQHGGKPYDKPYSKPPYKKYENDSSYESPQHHQHQYHHHNHHSEDGGGGGGYRGRGSRGGGRGGYKNQGGRGGYHTYGDRDDPNSGGDYGGGGYYKSKSEGGRGGRGGRGGYGRQEYD